MTTIEEKLEKAEGWYEEAKKNLADSEKGDYKGGEIKRVAGEDGWRDRLIEEKKGLKKEKKDWRNQVVELQRALIEFGKEKGKRMAEEERVDGIERGKKLTTAPSSLGKASDYIEVQTQNCFIMAIHNHSNLLHLCLSASHLIIAGAFYNGDYLIEGLTEISLDCFESTNTNNWKDLFIEVEEVLNEVHECLQRLDLSCIESDDPIASGILDISEGVDKVIDNLSIETKQILADFKINDLELFE
ncbi:6176_t:CDS:2, partial [Funneliformis caledonium]